MLFIPIWNMQQGFYTRNRKKNLSSDRLCTYSGRNFMEFCILCFSSNILHKYAQIFKMCYWKISWFINHEKKCGSLLKNRERGSLRSEIVLYVGMFMCVCVYRIEKNVLTLLTLVNTTSMEIKQSNCQIFVYIYMLCSIIGFISIWFVFSSFLVL